MTHNEGNSKHQDLQIELFFDNKHPIIVQTLLSGNITMSVITKKFEEVQNGSLRTCLHSLTKPF
mgnify:CR=1 FL=1